MVNAFRGEIAAELDGKEWTLCLTLGALANLETAFGSGDLSTLVERFSQGKLSADDLVKIIYAGLNGGGHVVSLEDVANMKAANGLSGYVDIVSRLLEATFTPHNSNEI